MQLAKLIFCVIHHQNFSLAHLGKLLKNQLVCQEMTLVSDEQMSVKVFTAMYFDLPVLRP